MGPALAPLLLALVPAQADAFWYPPERRGPVTAVLGARVGARPVAPGRARATLLLRLEGPAGLEARPRLEDAVEAWSVPRSYSAWSLEDGRVSQAVVLVLVQTKAGVMPLPTVRLRLRAGPKE